MSAEIRARSEQVRHGISLEYLTIGWNLLECGVAVVAGLLAGSVALLGFGFDSAIESISGGVLLWRLHAERKGRQVESVERRALKLVGVSFLILAAYVAGDGVKSLWQHEHPEHSAVGIILAIVSLVGMPLLARAKRKAAHGLASAALKADARQSSLCGYLSGILLGGLVLNFLLGWWWADPVAALIMAPIIAHEGKEALEGRECSCAD